MDETRTAAITIASFVRTLEQAPADRRRQLVAALYSALRDEGITEPVAAAVQHAIAQAAERK